MYEYSMPERWLRRRDAQGQVEELSWCAGKTFADTHFSWRKDTGFPRRASFQFGILMNPQKACQREASEIRKAEARKKLILEHHDLRIAAIKNAKPYNNLYQIRVQFQGEWYYLRIRDGLEKTGFEDFHDFRWLAQKDCRFFTLDEFLSYQKNIELIKHLLQAVI